MSFHRLNALRGVAAFMRRCTVARSALVRQCLAAFLSCGASSDDLIAPSNIAQFKSKSRSVLGSSDRKSKCSVVRNRNANITRLQCLHGLQRCRVDQVFDASSLKFFDQCCLLVRCGNSSEPVFGEVGEVLCRAPEEVDLVLGQDDRDITNQFSQHDLAVLGSYPW